jgi:hypothetical protein
MCSLQAASSCQAVHEDAVCVASVDTGPLCDLPCISNIACAAFRPGYTCEEGHCRSAPPPGRDAGTTPVVDASTPPVVDAGTLPVVDASTPAGGDASTGAPASGTLVSVLANDESGFIATPHTIHVLRAEDGAPFSPPLQVTTSAANGRFTLPAIPGDVPITLHVVGNGPLNDPTSTYDALKLDFDATRDRLLRISSVGTASVGETTGAYTGLQDRSELGVTVYFTSAGQRAGVVGCAKAFLDADPNAAADADLRYVARTGLPTTLAQQPSTLRSSGRFQFGNVPSGVHTVRVSVDDGATFIAEQTVYVPFTRAEAEGPYKSVHAVVDIEVPGPDPTPVNCP